ncbi:MAG: hypothetical protein ACI8WB_005329 [Phenylobacterium sp.]|jgi:hypothetical protein
MSVEHRLMKLPSFWLAVIIPLGLAVWLAFLIYNTADGSLIFAPTPQGLAFAIDYFQVPLLFLVLVIPSLALLISNQRTALLKQQMLSQQQQTTFANHYLHISQFNQHMPPELMKRLGMSSRVLHKVFYPHSREGDFALNDKLASFILFKFAEIVQASEVALKLAQSHDADEKAVAHNRIEYVMGQSVSLMMFFAARVKGQQPQCMDFYFLKDAMADYFDAIDGVVNFDGFKDGHFDLSAFAQLFDAKEVKAWFARNDNFLRLLCRENNQVNALDGEFEQL